MSALGQSASEQIWTFLHQMSLTRSSTTEQVWTGFCSWPLEVTSRRGQGLDWAGGGWWQGIPYMMRSKASWVMARWDPSCEQTDTHVWLKHYLPATSLAGGNYCPTVKKLLQGSLVCTWVYIPHFVAKQSSLNFWCTHPCKNYFRNKIKPCTWYFIT